jgi:type IV secretion system protein VirB5
MTTTAKRLQANEEPASPYLTRAAERYLEQYGGPIVMNTYLKVIILVLASIVVLLGVLVYRGQMALMNVHPMVIRVNDVGHAESVDYRDLKYRPQEAENKCYLSRWAELYCRRNRYAIQRDFTNSRCESQQN